jgi:hypothetical protein
MVEGRGIERSRWRKAATLRALLKISQIHKRDIVQIFGYI